MSRTSERPFTTETVRCIYCQNRTGLNGARCLGRGVLCCGRCFQRGPKTETLSAVCTRGEVEIVG
jgi:hypothetical protein